MERNLITVPEQIPKTGEECQIPIQPNLAAWLAPHAKESGFILPRERSPGTDDLLKTAKVAAACGPRSSRFQNALRKSFCSYHYEAFGSADRTAQFAGHDTRTLIKTYRHAVAHEEAEKFWAIYPEIANS